MKQILINILVSISVLFCIGVATADGSIGDVSVSFCHTQNAVKDYSFLAKAGESYPICLEFKSSSKEAIPIDFSFVDSVVTSDSLQTKACGNQGSKVTKYIKFDKRDVFVFSGKTSKLTGIIEFPVGFSGQISACLVYTVPEKKTKNTAMFDVIIRKANFIDGYVFGNFSRDLKFLEDLESHYVDLFDNSLVFALPFVNSGSLSENIVITGILTNSLGYERISTINKTISYGTSQIIKISFFDIPFYNGKYNLKLDISSSLPSSLDTSYVSQENIKTINYSYNIGVFLFPWKILFSILGILLILFLLRKVIVLFMRK